MSFKQLPLFLPKDDCSDSLFEHITLYVDGASKNNPGPAGLGVVITEPESLKQSMGYFIGIKTNNQAEYLALLYALWFVRAYNECKGRITIYADSELMVRQVNGLYRVKNERLKPLFLAATLFLKNCPSVVRHVARDKNYLADAMANRGVESKMSPPDAFKAFLQNYGVEL